MIDRTSGSGRLTESIIGAAIEVHRALGPALLEASSIEALCIELYDMGIGYDRQVHVPLVYKGRRIGDYRLDLVVGDSVIVEVKSVDRHNPVFEAQVLSYLRAAGKPVGLLINFNSRMLRDGVRRRVNGCCLGIAERS